MQAAQDPQLPLFGREPCELLGWVSLSDRLRDWLHDSTSPAITTNGGRGGSLLGTQPLSISNCGTVVRGPHARVSLFRLFLGPAALGSWLTSSRLFANAIALERPPPLVKLASGAQPGRRNNNIAVSCLQSPSLLPSSSSSLSLLTILSMSRL